MRQTAKQKQELRDFANALRAWLGKSPLYHVIEPREQRAVRAAKRAAQA